MNLFNKLSHDCGNEFKTEKVKFYFLFSLQGLPSAKPLEINWATGCHILFVHGLMSNSSANLQKGSSVLNTEHLISQRFINTNAGLMLSLVLSDRKLNSE